MPTYENNNEFGLKTCGNARKLIKEFPNQKREQANVGPLSAKVANNRFDQMHSRKQSATVVSYYR